MGNRMIGAVLAAAVLGAAGCGGEDEGAAGDPPTGAGNGADRAFAAAMVPHHESAIAMAQEARERGESRFVRELAEDIVRTQGEEIAVLRREDRGLAAAGVERGSLGDGDHMEGMDMAASALEGAADFDRPFLEMMIRHHHGAVTMARAELERGEDPELRALAREIAAAQEQEIGAMQEHLGGAGEEGHAGH